jgi:hypothetical protein
MDNKVQLLAVNTGSAEIILEKHEFPATESEVIKTTILEALNRMGKSAHILMKYQGQLWTASHTAPRGPSKDYFKSRVRYHPYASKLS